jgi:hypothetical protein
MDILIEAICDAPDGVDEDMYWPLLVKLFQFYPGESEDSPVTRTAWLMDEIGDELDWIDEDQYCELHAWIYRFLEGEGLGACLDASAKYESDPAI